MKVAEEIVYKVTFTKEEIDQIMKDAPEGMTFRELLSNSIRELQPEKPAYEVSKPEAVSF